MRIQPKALAGAKRAFARTHSSTVTILRLALTADSMGGETEAATNVATVPGRKYQLSAEERLETSRITDRLVEGLALPAGTDIRSQDRVDVDGVRYEVFRVVREPVSDEIEVMAEIYRIS